MIRCSPPERLVYFLRVFDWQFSLGFLRGGVLCPGFWTGGGSVKYIAAAQIRYDSCLWAYVHIYGGG